MVNIRTIKVENQNIEFELKGSKQKIVTSLIKWNKRTNSLMYYVIEPELGEKERTVVYQVNELAKNKGKNIKNISEVVDLYDFLKGKLSIETTQVQDAIIEYYVYRDLFGYGKLEGLIWDPKISFIAFDRIGAPLTVFHADYGYIPTNVIISTPNELSYLMLLLRERCISKNEDRDMLIGRTIINAAIFINKNTDTFSIRKTEKILYHPIELLMKIGLANIEMLSFIGFFLKNKGSILVIGPNASNKAEFISGICSLLDDSKILTFENVPEINLTSNKWISEVIPAHAYAENSIVDSLLRRPPDYLITNNVRGPALKKIINNSPKKYSNIVAIDAKSIEEGLKVLLSNPTNLDRSALINFDLIIFLTVEKHGTRYLQRIKEITEVVDYSLEEGKLKLNTVFKWDDKTDSILPFDSILLERFVKKTGKNPKTLIGELTSLIKSIKSLA